MPPATMNEILSKRQARQSTARDPGADLRRRSGLSGRQWVRFRKWLRPAMEYDPAEVMQHLDEYIEGFKQRNG